MRKILGALGATLTLGLAVVGMPVMGSSASVPTPASHAWSPQTPDCRAGAIANGHAGTPQIDCFTTLAQDISAQAGDGSLAQMSDAQARNMLKTPDKINEDHPAGAASAISGPLIGIEIQPNQSTLLYYGQNGPCTSSNWYPNTQQFAPWNNIAQAGSVQSGGCGIFELNNQTFWQGSWAACGYNQSYYGCQFNPGDGFYGSIWSNYFAH